MALSMKKLGVQNGKDLLVYGDPKSGKTTLLRLDPSIRILLLNLEGGDDVLEDAENIDIIDVNSWEDIIEVGKGLHAGFLVIDGKKYPTQTWDLIALDSITRLQDLCKDYVVRVLAPSRRREVKGVFGAQSDFGNLKEDLLGLVKGFHNLTKKGDKSINFLWLAHKVTDKDETTGKPLSTKIMVQGQGTAEIIMSYVDGVVYSFKRANKEGTAIEYGVATKQQGIINADVRIALHKPQLDNIIINPKLGDILETMNAYIPSRQK
jgi:hypothetical protein